MLNRLLNELHNWEKLFLGLNTQLINEVLKYKPTHPILTSPPSLCEKNLILQGFPGGAVVKNLPANAGDTGWSPGPGRSHMP